METVIVLPVGMSLAPSTSTRISIPETIRTPNSRAIDYATELFFSMKNNLE
jgi:hypothetical protein